MAPTYLTNLFAKWAAVDYKPVIQYENKTNNTVYWLIKPLFCNAYQRFNSLTSLMLLYVCINSIKQCKKNLVLINENYARWISAFFKISAKEKMCNLTPHNFLLGEYILSLAVFIVRHMGSLDTNLLSWCVGTFLIRIPHHPNQL